MINRGIWLVVILQLALLVFVAGKRELIMAQPESYYLRTAPVDPRDIFRGDFVTLSYEIAQLPDTLWKEFATENPKVAKQIELHESQHVVYLGITDGAGHIARRASLSLQKPDSGVFVKGRMGRGVYSRWWFNRPLKLGIEKYFVQQGAGIEIEKKLGARGEWQRPMEVEVAIGGDGTAVIKGHRWSDLSIRLQVTEPADAVRRDQRNSGTETGTSETERISAAVLFSLRNDSEVAIALPISASSFCELNVLDEGEPWRGNLGKRLDMVFPARDCAGYHAGDYRLKTLAPGETYSVPIDFANPDWFVAQQGETAELGQLAAARVFRLVYQPPEQFGGSPAELRTDDGVRLWLSPLRTAQFTIAGRID